MHKIGIPIAAVLVLGIATAVMARGVHRGSPGVARTEGMSLLGVVLADLVEDGTISQEQSEAITAALAEKRSQALEEAKAALDQLKAFWEDDVLTSDEISRLPRADRVTDSEGPFAEALEDGQITRSDAVDTSNPSSSSALPRDSRTPRSSSTSRRLPVMPDAGRSATVADLPSPGMWTWQTVHDASPYPSRS